MIKPTEEQERIAHDEITRRMYEYDVLHAETIPAVLEALKMVERHWGHMGPQHLERVRKAIAKAEATRS